MKKLIRINFSDFWRSFDKEDNYFTRLLRPHYHLEISDDPDFLIYSCYNTEGRLHWRNGVRRSAAKEFRNYKCIRIFYTSENVRPNFRECDYAFTYDYVDNPNHHRLPFYGLYEPQHKLPFVEEADKHPLIKTESFDPERILLEKTRFCNFLYSNRHAQKREDFFHKLSKYKKVDSGGSRLNNIGRKVKHKLSFLKKYKFTIAFENFSHPGYTTEKIYQPMLVNSLPIYWGNPLIHQDFNTKSFLNYHDFENDDALIEKIIEIDQNEELYLDYLKQPYFPNNRVNPFIDPHKVLSQFHYIFSHDKVPVAQNRFFFWRQPVQARLAR